MKMNFIKGVGIGMAAGTAVGMLVSPKKAKKKDMATKVLKAAEKLVENISDSVG